MRLLRPGLNFRPVTLSRSAEMLDDVCKVQVSVHSLRTRFYRGHGTSRWGREQLTLMPQVLFTIQSKHMCCVSGREAARAVWPFVHMDKIIICDVCRRLQEDPTSVTFLKMLLWFLALLSHVACEARRLRCDPVADLIFFLENCILLLGASKLLGDK